MIGRWLAIAVVVLTAACGDDRPPPSADAGGTDGGADAGARSTAALPDFSDCPAGWRQDGDPPVCEPFPVGGAATCTGATAHFVGEAGCVAVGAACPAGPWPSDLPATVLYVSSAAAPGGDGSMGQPYATVVEAAAAATSGTTIAVGAGTYDGPFQLADGVTLAGTCPDEVTITCTVTDCASGIVEVRSGSASIRDVRLTGERPALWVDGGVLRADGLLIERSRVGGIVVRGGGSLTGQGLVVRDVQPRASDGTAIALYVEEATVDLAVVAIETVPDVPINAVGTGAAVTLRRLSVRNASAPGIGATDGARVDVIEGYVGATSGHGFVVRDGGTAVTTDLVIVEDTRLDPLTGNGAAAEVRFGATLTMRRTVARRHVTSSLTAFEASTLILRDVVVEGQSSMTAPASGIGIAQGSTAELERVLVRDVGTSGIIVQEAGTVATLRDVTVRDTIPDSDGFFGRGLDVLVGATVEADRVHVARAFEVGFLIAGAGASANARELTVVDVRERRCAADTCADLGLGCGVSSVLDGTLSLDGFVIARNALCGLQLARGGVADATRGEITDNLIGANVQTDGFDTARINTDVVYRGNGRNLDAASVPVPDPGL